MKYFLLLILPMLISCGTLNKLKKKDRSKTDSSSAVKIDSSSSIKTVTSTTITEKLDTTAALKPDSAKAESNITDLQNGDTSDINTGTIEIKNYIDKKTKKLKTEVRTKPQPVDLHFSKTIIQNKQEDRKSSFDKASKADVKTENIQSEKNVSRESGGIATGFKLGVGFSILILLIVIYFRFRRRLREKFKFLP